MIDKDEKILVYAKMNKLKFVSLFFGTNLVW